MAQEWQLGAIRRSSSLRLLLRLLLLLCLALAGLPLLHLIIIGGRAIGRVPKAQEALQAGGHGEQLHKPVGRGGGGGWGW